MATIKEIAAKTGYSISTVSKALNGYSDISEKAKRKIVDVAEELNYYPNYSEKNLKKRDNKTIALLLNDLEYIEIDNGNAMSFMKGVNHYATSIGYDFVIHTTNHIKQESMTYYQYCKKQKVDGAIIYGISLDDPYFKELSKSNLPFVFKDIVPDKINKHMGVVTIDNYKAAFEAVTYLIKMGHSEIGLMSGNINAQVTNIRSKAYHDAMEAAGLEVNEQYTVFGDFRMKKAANAATKLLQTSPELTAIFCESDLMAVGVMEACKKLDIKIPEDLSVLGFDDNFVSRYLSPGLTTIRQDWESMGFAAGELLRDMINEESSDHVRYMEHELIIRDSVLNIC